MKMSQKGRTEQVLRMTGPFAMYPDKAPQRYRSAVKASRGHDARGRFYREAGRLRRNRRSIDQSLASRMTDGSADTGPASSSSSRWGIAWADVIMRYVSVPKGSWTEMTPDSPNGSSASSVAGRLKDS